MDESSVVVPVPGPQPARLRTDVFLTFGGKGITLLLTVATVSVVARALGPSGQGLFAVAYTLSLLLIQIGGLGLTTANPYFTARDRASRPRIVGNAVWFAAALGLVLVVVGVLLKLVAPDMVEGLGWTPLLVTLAGIPGGLAALFLQGVLLGEGRMVAYNAVDVAQAALTLAGLIVVLFVLDEGLTGALLVIAASRYAGALAYFTLLARAGAPALRPDVGLARTMLRYSFRIYVAALISLLVIRLDLLLVNAFLGSDEAGLYSVAAALADGMFVLPMVIGLNLLTRVARGDPDQATAEIFRSVFVLYGLVCLATVPFAGFGIRAIFGERYAEAETLYYWLLPGIFCLGMLTILSHHFAGRGFPRAAMGIWFVGLAVNLAINLAFLPGRGAWVAALASSISYALLLALHMWLFARDAGGLGVLRPNAREVVRFVRVAVSRG
jgi:O-antigen/teichoic acid export membrane protein